MVLRLENHRARLRGRAREAFVAAAIATGVLAIALASATVARGRQPGCSGATSYVRSAPAGVIRAAVVCLINDARANHGLPRLRGSGDLGRSAQHWTDVMVSAGSLSHGSNVGARISAAGFRWSNVGEIVGAGYGTPRQIVKAWMQSTTHCQVILDPLFADVGTGVAPRAVAGYARRGATWTADFALASGRRAPSGNWGPANGCPY
jgi:uncharacterized protein YkwD